MLALLFWPLLGLNGLQQPEKDLKQGVTGADNFALLPWLLWEQ